MYTSSSFSSIFNIGLLCTIAQVCLLAMQGQHRLLKLLFMVLLTRLVLEKLELILAGGIRANGNKSDIKDNSNLWFSGSNSSKLLYTLAELYLMLKFSIAIRSFNALMTMVLLAWPNLQRQILTCLFCLTKYLKRSYSSISISWLDCIVFYRDTSCINLFKKIGSGINELWSPLAFAIACLSCIKVMTLELLT